MNTDRFYDHVAKEIEQNAIVPGLWTRAYAESDGNEARAKALYIKYRIAQLIAADMPSKPPLEVACRWDFWLGSVIAITNKHSRPILLEGCDSVNSEGKHRRIISRTKTVHPERTIQIRGQVLQGEYVVISCAGFPDTLRFDYEQLNKPKS